MKCNVLAICDDQIVYSEFLVTQLLRMGGKNFRIYKFSSLAKLQVFAMQQEVHCLVISECFEEQVRALPEMCVKQYICLTSDRQRARIKESGDDGKRRRQYIFRYQSVEKIYEQLSELCSEEDFEELLNQEELLEGRLVGIYNPVHRNGQTTFAKSLAAFYGSQGRSVLYLNMEEYAGMIQEKGQNQGDLGEVLYYLKQDIKSINFRLAAFTKKVDNYDMVEPIHMSTELCRITMEEWCAFFQEVVGRSGYEIIILDLDSCVQGLLEILELCQVIYMPICEANGGEDKRTQFEDNLRKLQREGILEKIEKKYLVRVRSDIRSEIEEDVQAQVATMFDSI